jgi:predicted nucleotidyltransferase
MRKLDIDPHHLELLLALIDRYAPHAEVWAFGSRVAGGAHEGSDIDLVLRNCANPDCSVPELPGLRARIRESNLPILVDLLDWSAIPPEYREQISREHYVLRTPK